MSNMPMTPEQEYEFYAKAENQEPQGPARPRQASRLGPGLALPCRCASRRNCWTRHAGLLTAMTGRCLRGFVAPSSTNWAVPPNSDSPASELRRRRPHVSLSLARWTVSASSGNPQGYWKFGLSIRRC